jgi:SAM-dependent methyltransferase
LHRAGAALGDDEDRLAQYERVYFQDRTHAMSRALEDLADLPSRRLLDIGCGRGALMEIAGRMGYLTWGIERMPFAAACAQHRTGRPVENAAFEETRLADDSFDLVTMTGALEQADDPGRLLERARRLICGRGVAVIQVTGIDRAGLGFAHWLARASRGRITLPMRLLWRRHRWNFNAHTLRVLLERSGFEWVRSRAAGSQLIVVARKKAVVKTWRNREEAPATLAAAA